MSSEGKNRKKHNVYFPYRAFHLVRKGGKSTSIIEPRRFTIKSLRREEAHYAN